MTYNHTQNKPNFCDFMIIQIKTDIPVRRGRLVHAIGALSTPFFESDGYEARTQAIAK